MCSIFNLCACQLSSHRHWGHFRPLPLYPTPGWVLCLWNFRLSELNSFSFGQQGEYVSCLLSLLRQMSDTHFQHLLDNFQSKDELKVQQNIMFVGQFTQHGRAGEIPPALLALLITPIHWHSIRRPSFHFNNNRCCVTKTFKTTGHWIIFVTANKFPR